MLASPFREYCGEPDGGDGSPGGSVRGLCDDAWGFPVLAVFLLDGSHFGIDIGLLVGFAVDDEVEVGNEHVWRRGRPVE